MKEEVAGSIALGEGLATVRRRGHSSPVVAKVLGVEAGSTGEVERVYLDRLVHRPGEHNFGTWRASGAISTVLTRSPDKSA